MERPTFYYDLSSVYAYLAAERIGALIPDADWRPIVLFGLFRLNGRSSWFFSEDERNARLPEIAERADRYGLPPLRWAPNGIPDNLAALGRAATVAKRHGREVPFSLAAFRAMFVEGRDPSDPGELRRLAAETGLDGDGLLHEITQPDLKEELRAATDEAHERGAPGVPTVIVRGQVFWGDDRLEDAAAAVR